MNMLSYTCTTQMGKWASSSANLSGVAVNDQCLSCDDHVNVIDQFVYVNTANVDIFEPYMMLMPIISYILPIFNLYLCIS